MSAYYKYSAAAAEKPRAKEKRRYPRSPVVIKVDYTTVDSFFSEFSRNINEGGIFIETPKPHEPGTAIELVFSLPESGRKINVQGEVVWTREEGDEPDEMAGMGIRFHDLSPEDKELINTVVRKLRKD